MRALTISWTHSIIQLPSGAQCSNSFIVFFSTAVLGIDPIPFWWFQWNLCSLLCVSQPSDTALGKYNRDGYIKCHVLICWRWSFTPVTLQMFQWIYRKVWTHSLPQYLQRVHQAPPLRNQSHISQTHTCSLQINFNHFTIITPQPWVWDPREKCKSSVRNVWKFSRWPFSPPSGDSSSFC